MNTPNASPTPPIKLGRTVRALRERFGLSREVMADRLVVSHATMDEIEANTVPTPVEFADRFREVFAIDLHTAAWCLFGDVANLPEAVRESAAALTESCRAELMAKLGGVEPASGAGPTFEEWVRDMP